MAILQVSGEETAELVYRIQNSLDKHDYGFGGANIYLGMSVGWASFGTEGSTLDELLLAADRAMYANKQKRKALLSGSADPKTADLNQYRLM